MSADPRTRAIAERLDQVRASIAAACARAGRDAAEVTLVAVTKTYPAEDVLRLAQLGVPDIGENRDAEAAPKAAHVQAAGVDVRWHFVGQLQRNKCRSVVRYAALVHSVDSVSLARTLDAQAQRHREQPLDVLVQVSLDGDRERGGVLLAEDDPERGLDRVVDAVQAAHSLRLRGAMTVAPLAWDPESAYQRFAEVAQRLAAVEPSATIMSAGMSGDFESAIDYGATHVRIGSALLGKRAALR